MHSIGDSENHGYKDLDKGNIAHEFRQENGCHYEREDQPDIKGALSGDPLPDGLNDPGVLKAIGEAKSPAKKEKNSPMKPDSIFP